MHVADRLYDRKYLTLRGRVSISLLSFLFFPTQALSNIPFNVNFEKKKEKEKKILAHVYVLCYQFYRRVSSRRIESPLIFTQRKAIN